MKIIKLTGFLVLFLCFSAVSYAQNSNSASPTAKDALNAERTRKVAQKSGRFEILTNTKGNYYFVLKSTNGRVIMSGFTHKSKDSVMEKIAEVKTLVSSDENFDIRATGPRYHFYVNGSDGKAVAKSEFYTTEASMRKGLESVKKNAPLAVIKE